MHVMVNRSISCSLVEIALVTYNFITFIINFTITSVPAFSVKSRITFFIYIIFHGT